MTVQAGPWVGFYSGRLTLYTRMTDKSLYALMAKDVKAVAKRYHSPVRIATSFVSGLWLGWGFP